MHSDDPETMAHAALVLGGLAGGSNTVVSPSFEYVLPSVASGQVAEALAGIVGSLNFGAVAETHNRLLLHAGAVGWPDGGTVLLCGPSGSGKSTLTAVLVGRGWAYVTDETVSLDPQTLRITPYRKPLSVKPGSQDTLRRLAPAVGSIAAMCTGANWLLPPAELRGPALPQAPLRPRLIVFPTYEKGSQIRLERLAPSEAACLLGGNSSRLREVPDPLEALVRLVRHAPAYRLLHGEVEAAADQVQSLWDAA